MSYPINYPTPQGANVQIFTDGGNSAQTPKTNQTWIKPQGASFVWFTLIGCGGSGNGTTGGGSGGVTNFMCPAFLIPDLLNVRVFSGGVGDNTIVTYQQKDGTGYLLLSGMCATGSTAGTAMTANAFTAMGFFQSVAGQAGASGAITASTTTFLSGGSATSVASNYGYSTAADGFFQMQPIIVGAGGIGSRKGGIGCGAGSTVAAKAGDGMVVIITW